MTKFFQTFIFISILLAISLAGCRNEEEEVNMRNYSGYPLFADPDSIQNTLAGHCIDTIDFRPGEFVADIGAGNGYLEGMLTLKCDSVTFYIQDIDSMLCNELSVNRVKEFYNNLREGPLTCTFIPVNGTESTTCLPDSTFDKILMLYTYQYLKDPVPYILDVKKKLKRNGFFYVVNPQYDNYSNLEFQRTEYGWNSSPLEKQISDIISCGFELVKMGRNFNDFDNPYLMIFKIRS